MRLLLDTPAAVAFLEDDPALGAGAAAGLEDPANQVLLSTVVVWEIAIKRALGKLPVDHRYLPLLLDSGAEPLATSLEHARAVEELPHHDRDRFHRREGHHRHQRRSGSGRTASRSSLIGTTIGASVRVRMRGCELLVAAVYDDRDDHRHVVPVSDVLVSGRARRVEQLDLRVIPEVAVLSSDSELATTRAGLVARLDTGFRHPCDQSRW